MPSQQKPAAAVGRQQMSQSGQLRLWRQNPWRHVCLGKWSEQTSLSSTTAMAAKETIAAAAAAGSNSSSNSNSSKNNSNSEQQEAALTKGSRGAYQQAIGAAPLFPPRVIQGMPHKVSVKHNAKCLPCKHKKTQGDHNQQHLH